MNDIDKLSEQELLKLIDKHLYENKDLIGKIINQLKLSSNPSMSILDILSILENFVSERISFKQALLAENVFFDKRIDKLQQKYDELNTIVINTTISNNKRFEELEKGLEKSGELLLHSSLIVQRLLKKLTGEDC